MPADDGWHLVLELRNPHLRSHPNEVSFPGGRIEHEPVRVEMQDGVRPGENFPYERVASVVPGWTGRQKYDVYFYTYGDFTIWGLTARIIKNFLQICREQKVSFDFDFRQWRGDLP